MQYTGLKDENGKEIFEGDIVSTNFPHNKETVEEIVFNQGEGWNGFGKGRDENFVEIKGNIYENPELRK